ncbi:hypothetical protein WJX81_006836 [Elliptochloris bilobata]|uniref:Protein kinase domain-containing protein n=1 Tax=Elliptochloris bilobata TaxID=381761 RepID=A0AAW1QIK6_9CHLO
MSISETAISQSVHAQAGEGAAQPEGIHLPPLESDEEEVQWVKTAVSRWLDEEWLPQSVHHDLGEAAGQAYVAARKQGSAEAGDVLLDMSRALLSFNYRDTFVNAFDVANKVIELKMLHSGHEVCCQSDDDRRRFERSLASHSKLRRLLTAPAAQAHFGWAYSTDNGAVLAYEEIPAPGLSEKDADTCLLVHGLLGSGRNWRTFSRRLVAEAYASSGRRWRVILVDQRCHGASTALPGFHPPHNLEAAGCDLARLVAHSLGGQAPAALVGHSLGGKAVLQYLREAGKGSHSFLAPQQAWVLDSPVGQAAPGARTGEADRVLDDLRCIKTPLPSRQGLYDVIADRGYSAGVLQWLGSNLTPARHRDGLVWTFDVGGAAAMLASYKRSDYWDVVDAPPQGAALHIVRADQSDRWPRQEWQRLEVAAQAQVAPAPEGQAAAGNSADAGEGRLFLHTLPAAGHWLHVDNPDGLRELMLPSFFATTKPEEARTSDDGGDAPLVATARPPCASPPKDAAFVVEDDAAADAAEALLACAAVVDLAVPGGALLHASRGLEQLVGFNIGSGSGSGSTKGGAGLGALLEQGPSSEALRIAAKSGVPGGAMVALLRHDSSRVSCIVSCLPSSAAARHEAAALVLRGMALADGIAPEAPFVRCSAGFAEVTGFSEADVRGRGCLCLAGPLSNGREGRALLRAHRSDRPHAARLLCYRRSGQPFWALIVSLPLGDAGAAPSNPHPNPTTAPPPPPPLHQAPPSAAAAAMAAAAAAAAAAAEAAAAPPKLPPAPPAPERLLIVVDVTAAALKRVGAYELGRMIGRGAFGTVCLGRRVDSGEVVAVKVIDASTFSSIAQIEAVQEELAVLSGLRHPYIIRLLDSILVASRFYFVMEYASGGSLVDFVHTRGGGRRLAEGETRRVFAQIIDAVDYCHRRRVIHRDLKPENILMDDACNVKVADFGLAGITTPFSGSLSAACGTPEFTAPEIIRGEEYEGASVDVWSLGVILYELATGRLPFRAATTAALFAAIAAGSFPPLGSGVSAPLRDLVRQMLVGRAAQRITIDGIRAHAWLAAGNAPDASASAAARRSRFSTLGPASLQLVVPGTEGAAPGVLLGDLGAARASRTGAAVRRHQAPIGAGRPSGRK